MSFKNVEVKTEANIFHDGRVTSRTITTAAGERKTLGVMLPGTYQFNTGSAEVIDVTQGRCRVKIEGQSDWKEYKTGQSFSVPAKTRFDIEIVELLDYVCHFS